MDYDGSGFLTENKFLEFWRRVKEQGVTDDEINVQLEMIKLKEIWIGFDLPKDYHSEATDHSRVSLSKQIQGQDLPDNSYVNTLIRKAKDEVTSLLGVILYRYATSKEEKHRKRKQEKLFASVISQASKTVIKLAETLM